MVCDILKASHTYRADRTAGEGLELLSSMHFGVVISDIKLPEMDGDAFLRAAHAMAPAVPAILMSGGHGYDERTYEEEGALGYLLKPFRAEALEELVASALGS